jgi:hypothetical protein
MGLVVIKSISRTLMGFGEPKFNAIWVHFPSKVLDCVLSKSNYF